MIKRSVLYNFVQSMPLIVFIVLYKSMDPITPREWLTPYLAGAAASIFSVLYLKASRLQANSILTGINIYLLTGCFGILTQQAWLLRFYGNLEASGMLLWVVVVGIISLFFSPSGFIDVNSKNRKLVTGYSVCLLAVAIIAFLLAYSFRTIRFFAETVPFIILFVAYGVLKSRAQSKLSVTRG